MLIMQLIATEYPNDTQSSGISGGWIEDTWAGTSDSHKTDSQDEGESNRSFTHERSGSSYAGCSYYKAEESWGTLVGASEVNDSLFGESHYERD